MLIMFMVSVNKIENACLQIHTCALNKPERCFFITPSIHWIHCWVRNEGHSWKFVWYPCNQHTWMAEPSKPTTLENLYWEARPWGGFRNIFFLPLQGIHRLYLCQWIYYTLYEEYILFKVIWSIDHARNCFFRISK